MLHPVRIPHALECEILENGLFINNKDDFLKSIADFESSFPTPLYNMTFSCDNDGQFLLYLRIADECKKYLMKIPHTLLQTFKNKRDILIPKFKKAWQKCPQNKALF